MSFFVNALRHTSYAALAGIGTSAVVYGYNRAGESGKLPSNWGYVKPAETFAKVMGSAAFLAYLGKPQLTLPVTALIGGSACIKAINNSMEEIRLKNTKNQASSTNPPNFA